MSGPGLGPATRKAQTAPGGSDRAEDRASPEARVRGHEQARRGRPTRGPDLPRAAAVGAASWTARDWLGLPGLADGTPADLVVFDDDPVPIRTCCTIRA